MKRKPIERRRTPSRIPRELFDDVIDCLYEHDLSDELPDTWPQHVCEAIEKSRRRILSRSPRPPDRAVVFDVLDELTIYLVRHHGVIPLHHPTLQRAQSILAAGGGES
jgi:hypothetical protein